LLPHYDPSEASRLAKEILTVLNGSTVMEVENSLLGILNYEHFDLISLFLQNRKAIYYGVRYHQAPTEKSKEQLVEEMKAEGLFIGQQKAKAEPTRVRSQENEEELTFRLTKDDNEISRIPKKILDLNILDSEDRTAGGKQEYRFKLPEGAEKLDRVGYEEVFIPASQKVVK
jgi:hypothetical protein